MGRADMSGYIYEFEVDQGKSQDTPNSKDRFGLGGSVVDRLTQTLKGGGYVVVMDNYFTSVELKANNIFAYGTLHPNKKHLPKLQEDKEMKIGDFDYRSTGTMSSPDQPKRRRKNKYSVPKDIRTQNLDAHWAIFIAERGRCEMCSIRKIQPRPHSKGSFCNVFVCMCVCAVMTKITAFKNIMFGNVPSR